MPPQFQSQPRQACDSQLIAQGIATIAQGILARHAHVTDLALVGIHSGGDLLVRRVEAALALSSGQGQLNLDKGLLDINFYRDDWSRLGQIPALRATQIPFAVDGRSVVLVDDVIFTGRTVRAALEGLFSLGRPASIELAVLIDRGHREFPIEPDYVGIYLPTELHQAINVYLNPNPSLDQALLEDHKYHLLRSA